MFVGIILLSTDLIKFKTTVAQNGHLMWHWLPLQWWLYLPWIVFLILPMHFYEPFGYGVFFVTTILIASMITYAKDRTWGSMWCWFAAVASFYYVFVAFYKSGFCIR